MTDTPPPLPIDSLVPKIGQSLCEVPRVVLVAPPGTGKTTRIPPALMNAACVKGEVWVAEPRRLAARLVADRVAREQGVRLGTTVGYAVRFDRVGGPETRLWYVTNGVLLRRLAHDPKLGGIGCVIFDEFHERRLDGDLGLSLVMRAQARRPNLCVVVMSATLDTDKLLSTLWPCELICCDEHRFEVAIEHELGNEARSLERRTVSAVRRLLGERHSGRILVFLPGASEIRQVRNLIIDDPELRSIGLRVLHGDMPLDAQAQAVAEDLQRAIVLSTNVAESSITVPGVTAVVDSGLVRRVDCSPATGLPRRSLGKASRASVTQRAGRAGRTAPGRVVRLYSSADFEARPEAEVPEMLRLDLAEARLILAGIGVTDPAELRFVDAPQLGAWQRAAALLVQLGALDGSGRLTALGTRMLALPLHPRLSRVLIEAERRHIARFGAAAVAVLSGRDLRASARTNLDRKSGGRSAYGAPCDVQEQVELLNQAAAWHFAPRKLAGAGIDSAAALAAERARSQLSKMVDTSVECDETDEASGQLRMALMTGFSDRVAKRLAPRSEHLVMTSGARARLGFGSAVTDAMWLLAIEADEQAGRGRGGDAVVRVASAIDPDWLIDICAEGLSAERESVWSETADRVFSIQRIRYGSLVVEESRTPLEPGPECARVLCEVALRRGILDGDPLVWLTRRVELLVELGIVEPSAASSAPEPRETLHMLCSTRSSLQGLDAAQLALAHLGRLDPELRRSLDRAAPEALRLPSGRRCTIRYEPGQIPFISSRLQDFFGMLRTPTIGDGRLSLTLHLLAPNGRPVQITQDLEGFWSIHYPKLRRALQRRYPRHAWPEDGSRARSTEPTRRR